ncbi:Ribosomal protein lysine methyltransferase [Rhizina undulata]
MTLDAFLSLLGDEIEDVYEESFLLFSTQKPLSRNLGFIDRASPTIDITVAGQDLTIHQSPTILSSSREAGTTGAVLWRVTPAFADWICSKSNPLFAHGVLSAASSVLELGAGVSAVLALTLGSRVGRYLLSDQEYALKLAQKNLDENLSAIKSLKSKKPVGRKGTKGTKKGNNKSNNSMEGDISVIPVDWETDSIRHHPSFQTRIPLSAVIACDCIYNESLVKPFVDICVDACSILPPQTPENNTRKYTTEQQTPTIVIVAQELRSPDVFENWLETFYTSFHTYRVPDNLLSPELESSAGFSVHIGVLRSTPLSK